MKFLSIALFALFVNAAVAGENSKEFSAHFKNYTTFADTNLKISLQYYARESRLASDPGYCEGSGQTINLNFAETVENESVYVKGCGLFTTGYHFNLAVHTLDFNVNQFDVSKITYLENDVEMKTMETKNYLLFNFSKDIAVQVKTADGEKYTDWVIRKFGANQWASVYLIVKDIKTGKEFPIVDGTSNTHFFPGLYFITSDSDEFEVELTVAKRSFIDNKLTRYASVKKSVKANELTDFAETLNLELAP
jgi:hypothetical protein